MAGGKKGKEIACILLIKTINSHTHLNCIFSLKDTFKEG